MESLIPPNVRRAINREKASVEVINFQRQGKIEEFSAQGVSYADVQKKLQPFKEDIAKHSRLAHQIESEFIVSEKP